ncbi:hypothetical protein C5B76_10950 [Aeromonas salmonicida]|uniref:hypothetical protein n=1 Tax=Aeromonas salmonicida TaxID=645 RepID=UPI000F768D2E|nr:hypothetical protein [Aeromonas salmonicida]RSM26079.1 hypothetical protein C5B76_10950 [Aeromonas salmonicida]
MKKQKAAPQNGTTPNTHTDVITRKPSKAHRIELACLHLLGNAQEGTTRITATHFYGDFDYRNRIDELRNDHGIKIESRPYEHMRQDGGISRLSLYYLPDRHEARKVAELVNLKRKQRGAASLSQVQISSYLARFPLPSQTGHQPTA